MNKYFDLDMEKEKAVNKAIELEFGVGNSRSIREHNSSLVKVAEHLYDLLQPSTPPDFDTEVYNWLREHGSDETRQLIEMTARHFWEMAQNGGAMLYIAGKSYKMGRRDERIELMKDAVEGYVCGRVQNHINIKVEGIDELEPKGVMHILADKSKYKIGDKVKVIIVKAEEEK